MVTRPFRFSRDWQGGTVVIMGNGTSMLHTDLSPIAKSGAFSMVTNGGYTLYPEADVLMCSDRHWLAEQKSFDGYKGPMVVTTQPQALRFDDPRVVAVRRYFIMHAKAEEMMRSNPGVLVEGHTSVMTCISAAVHRGVHRIILIGMDLRPGPERKRRATDSLTDDPALARRRYVKQAMHFGLQANILQRMGVEVINCSPPSLLKAFPMSTLEEALGC